MASTLIGVLVDVSGSMEAVIGKRPNQKHNQKESSWARSIFKVVEELIKHDVSSANHVFALAFGASKEPQAFDLLGTVDANKKLLPLPYRNKTKAEVVEELLQMTINEIRPTPSWAKVDVLMKAMTKSDAYLFVEELKNNSDFRREFASVCELQTQTSSIGNAFYSLMFNSQGMTHTNAVDEAREVVKRSLTFKIIEEILNILEHNDAPRVRTWANIEVLLDVVKRSVASSFLDELKRDDTFRRRFVQECLPESCRKVTHGVTSYFKEVINSGARYIPKAHEYATRGSVKEVVAKGKELLSEFLEMVPIDKGAIMDVHKASEILHGGVGEDELTDERVDELMDAVEPLIYGRTPLMTTIDEAKKLFKGFEDHRKLMFIISDGISTDGNDPPMKKLAELGVTTVCCYITKDAIADPRRLYSTECKTWDKAAKLMFQMSSTITTQMIPRTIFVKRKWNIDITNNKTCLFVQVNHPDIIKDVCDLARDVVCCQDALSDLLTTVSLDLYINQANEKFVPQKQKGGTCYANASAAVLHLSMKQIVGRDGGRDGGQDGGRDGGRDEDYPDFFKLREEMITRYGEDDADTLKVLQDICPKYRLQCKAVGTLGAMKAITAKRPVLARFWLTNPEWVTFDNFYEQSRRGVLTSAVLDIKRRPPGAKLIGHAVVLTSFNSESLRLMNSQGSNWGDGGFFKVSNADVLGLEFVDVFWTKEDLKQSEIDAYQRRGPTIAQEMFSRLQGLQTVQYPCPSCRQSSNVTDFSGHHLEAECPKCHQRFDIKEAGDDLALNMYLLSLSASGV